MEPSQRSASAPEALTGSRHVGDWALSHRIGSGSFAVVWQAKHRHTGQLAAVKEIWTEKLNRKLQESLESEMSILAGAKHQNIVRLLEIIKEKDQGRIYLVLEFCAGGDLSGVIRKSRIIPEPTIRFLMQQLAAGLKELRAHNLIHRDLKPQNLLLSSAQPDAVLKIADFGFARNLQPQGLAETLCGSPLYMAPEILQFHKYDAKADLWSVGAIMFEMVAGQTPFNGRNHVELLRNIERQEARLPVAAAARVSAPCRQLLMMLLKKNPVQRIGFEEFFSHPFLTDTSALPAEEPPVASITKPAGGQQPADPPASTSRSSADPRGQTHSTSSGRGSSGHHLPFLPDEDLQLRDSHNYSHSHNHSHSGGSSSHQAAHMAMQSPSPGHSPRRTPAGAEPPMRKAQSTSLSATPTPANNIFTPSSLPRMQHVTALWDGLLARRSKAANAADQRCEQFAAPAKGKRVIELEQGGSNDSLAGSFERDFVVISTEPEESQGGLGASEGGESSHHSDGSHADAAIAGAALPRPQAPSRQQQGLQPARGVEREGGKSKTSLAMAHQDSGLPPRHSPRSAAGTLIPLPIPTGSQLSRQDLLQAAAELMLSLAVGRASGKAHAEALVLSWLSMQTLTVASRADDGGREQKERILRVLGEALGVAQASADALQETNEGLSPGTSAPELPCPLELTYRLALDYGRAGAVNELMGNYTRSVTEYAAASTLLSFLLTEVPRMPPTGALVSLGRSLPAPDERRLKRYMRSLNVRSASSVAQRSSPGGAVSHQAQTYTTVVPSAPSVGGGGSKGRGAMLPGPSARASFVLTASGGRPVGGC